MSMGVTDDGGTGPRPEPPSPGEQPVAGPPPPAAPSPQAAPSPPDVPREQPVAPPPPAAPSAIFAADLQRSFGAVRAVAGVDLNVRRGTVTALIGPNGSGKTTLLLMLAGLLAPDHGQLAVAGADPASSAQARSRIGWMPDVFGTWDSLTAFEILTTMGAAYRLPAATSKARAYELLATVHLSEYARAPAQTLSRGQKQRLGLARALVNHPDVLLLDEPASGLDPRSRVDLRVLLRSLADAGATVLISSHVLAELDGMVDDAVFISRGATVSSQELLASTSARRRWRLHSLDAAALYSWAQQVQLPLLPDSDAPPGAASVLVELPDEQTAARLLADAVRAGVPLSSLAPVGGLLEQAYMTLDADRR